MNGRKDSSMPLSVCVFLLALVSTAAGKTIYVDIGGGAEFTSIQTAINDANDGDEIEVAPGAYYEDINFNGKAIRLYSSSGPDVTTIDANGAYHVVQCANSEDANTVLEGFTITGGNADGVGTDASGGGMYNDDGSSPTVNNCTFIDNSARGDGGGMYNLDSGTTVINCRFIANSSEFTGGGMCNYGGSTTVTDCTFTGNKALEYGGGMTNSSGSPMSDISWGVGGGMFNSSSLTLVNCEFNGNVAVRSPHVTGSGVGGGIYNSGSNVNIRDCRFSVNYGAEGAGIYNYHSSPAITGCSFIRNMVTQYHGGAGMQNDGSSPTVDNCTFSGNAGTSGWSPDAGGMLNQASSNPTVTNCIFVGNRGFFVGGIYSDSCVTTVTNCTFSANVGEFWFAGAIDGVRSVVTNCVLWGNTPMATVGDVAVTYSDVQGGFAGDGNIEADPLFVRNPDSGADGNWGTADDDYGDLHFLAGSPCIDKGCNAGVPPGIATDLDGYQRIIDGDCNDIDIADMGAYEFNYAYMGDFDYQCDVDLEDFAILGLAWMTQPGDAGWNGFCSISTPVDNSIDWRDLSVLCRNWLAIW